MNREKLAKDLGYSSIPDFIARLDQHQLNYISQGIEKSTYLDACPGSGKTEVISIKCAREFSTWSKKNSGMAVLSFTNSASRELEQRIRKYNPNGGAFYPHYVGTFDSWLHKFFLQPHGWAIFKNEPKRGDRKFVIVSDSERMEYMSGFDYSLVAKGGKTPPVGVNQFDYSDLQSRQIKIGNARKELSAKQVEDLQVKKRSWFEAGYATYDDVSFIVRRLIGQKRCLARIIAGRFPVVLIDECQDLSAVQNGLLEILKEEGASIHYIGDLRQSIYGYRKASPEKTREFIRNNNLEYLQLLRNYRSGQSIVNVCIKQQGLTTRINGLDDAIPSPCWYWEYNQENLNKLQFYFEQTVEKLGFSVSDSAIVARGQSIISRLQGPRGSKNKNNAELLANSLFQWGSMPRASARLDDAIRSMGKLLSKTLYSGKGIETEYYCPDSVNAIQWRGHISHVITIFLDEELLPFDVQDCRLTWTQFAGKAREIFKRRAQDMGFSELESVLCSRGIRAPSRRGGTMVISDFFVTTDTTSTAITPRSIHSVKGMTFDSVLCVSALDRKSNGGHIAQWLSTESEDESTRFAYVAWSRPRNLLILAIPEATDKKIRCRLESFGFVRKTWGQPPS